jgi:hypothetical protein
MMDGAGHNRRYGKPDKTIDPDAVLESIIASEEVRFDLIKSSPDLRAFSRRIEHWELLLRILQSRDNLSLGLNDLPSLCQLGGMHDHSLTRFLREQVAAGRLYTVVGDRRDKKVVRASSKLIEQFSRL